jgi:crotonobetainyl-CoA:carnitine CoA-transferase CaiB-like acyl-CoA transferase
LFAALGVLAALLRRTTTATGDCLDVSMSDCVVAVMAPSLVPVANGQAEGAGPGTLRVVCDEPGYGPFRTADGRYITLSIAYEDHFWHDLCIELGLEGEADIGTDDRLERRDELRSLVQRRLLEGTAAEWLERLGQRGVPVGPLHRLADVPDDPHVRARGMFAETGSGPSRQVHCHQPIRFASCDRGTIVRGSPAVGEHTAEVLRTVGLPPDVVDRIVERARHATGVGGEP